MRDPVPPLPPRPERMEAPRYSDWIDLGDYQENGAHPFADYQGWKIKVRLDVDVETLAAVERVAAEPMPHVADMLAALRGLLVAWNFVNTETWRPLPQPPAGIRRLRTTLLGMVFSVAASAFAPAEPAPLPTPKSRSRSLDDALTQRGLVHLN